MKIGEQHIRVLVFQVVTEVGDAMPVQISGLIDIFLPA